MLKKVTYLVLIFIFIVSLNTGCSKKETIANEGNTNLTEKTSEIKLALVGPMTGDSAQYGIQFERGVKEAIDMYNAMGSVQIKLDVFDDKNDAKEAVSIANKIIADGEYLAVIGPFSSTCALAMAEVLDEEKIITISPTCSHIDYVSLYDYTFRLAHVNAYEGVQAARYLKDNFNAKKVAGIYSNNDWGIAVDDAFIGETEKIGVEVVANESFILGQTKDFSAIITKIKQAGAEAVYYMGQYTEAAMVMKQIKDMNLDIDVLITTSSYKIESLELAGDACEGVSFMTAFFVDPDNTKVADFYKVVKEKYDAKLDNFILRACDAAAWILNAYDKCQSTDPDVLKQALMDLGSNGVDGLGGYFKLDENRNVEREFMYTRWNGKSGDEIAFELIK